MRRALLVLLALIFLAGCAEERILEEEEISGGVGERISDESDSAQDLTDEEQDWKLIVGNQSQIHRGVYVNFDGVYKDEGSRKLYFIFEGDDRFENEAVRGALEWGAYIYFAKKNVKSLFLCDFENGEKTWKGEYCEPEDSIPEGWFDQNIWVIYTVSDPVFINENSILDIISEEYTFVFKTRIPKP
ncbi:MAG: hypothetical protein AABW87_02170 [Nanoarchaeota archaeon]